MHKELSCLDRTLSKNDIISHIFYAINKSFDLIVVPSVYLPIDTPIGNLKLSTPIDYPYGQLSTETRINAIIQAEKKGCQVVDLVLNHSLIQACDWYALEHDIKCCLKVCKDKKLICRAMIDYRILSDEMVVDLSKKLIKLGIEYVITTTYSSLDDWIDNLLMCIELQDKCGNYPIMATNNLISKEMYSMIEKANIFGIGFYSLVSAKNVFGV